MRTHAVPFDEWLRSMSLDESPRRDRAVASTNSPGKVSSLGPGAAAVPTAAVVSTGLSKDVHESSPPRLPAGALQTVPAADEDGHHTPLHARTPVRTPGTGRSTPKNGTPSGTPKSGLVPLNGRMPYFPGNKPEPRRHQCSAESLLQSLQPQPRSPQVRISRNLSYQGTPSFSRTCSYQSSQASTETATLVGSSSSSYSSSSSSTAPGPHVSADVGPCVIGHAHVSIIEQAASEPEKEERLRHARALAAQIFAGPTASDSLNRSSSEGISIAGPSVVSGSPKCRLGTASESRPIVQTRIVSREINGASPSRGGYGGSRSCSTLAMPVPGSPSAALLDSPGAWSQFSPIHSMNIRPGLPQ